MSGRTVQVIERAIDCVEVLVDGPKTLTEIVTATGLPKGTVFRILATLSYGGIVAKDPLQGRYMLGAGVMRLVQGLMDGVGALGVYAQPVLVKLAESTGETTTLHVRLGTLRLCIAEQPSRQVVRYTATVGATAPLHVGAAGKILLASMAPADRRKVLRNLPLAPLTPKTITAVDALEAELATVKEQGWAVSEGERVLAGAAISAPVADPSAGLAALSILGPANRLTYERRLELLPQLQASAKAIERAAPTG